MNRQNRLVAGVAVLALAAGLGVATWLQRPGPAQPGAGEALLAVQLPDLQNRPHSLERYRGKVLVVNFWATWCPPCREEIPVFIEAQAQHGKNGLQLVGIALDDPRQVADFAEEYGINYPVLIGGANESEILRKLGNPGGGLPYTLVYDRDGQLRDKIIGGLDKTRLEGLVAPLI
ncbi:TlpA family protein disulfide reductase [Betaproteobacteria bacterium SCN2]|jgi:thiol-disulfide isomerase/thioredoxin|nr:TlpA family protein disulfide reductase [Betaproteobacteria bacterium SCN2]